MAYYFSIPHLGAGSSEVESLGCHFFRLARAHGCTQWQLASHLAAWWDHQCADGRQTRFPKVAVTQPSLAVSGYGQDVGKLVEVLSVATGATTLRSGTLMSLHGVASRSSIGTLRTGRAWCPACYEEDAAGGGEAYDRLVWAIAPIKRCSHHKVALVDRCPACNSTQLYFERCTRLDVCGNCEAHLCPPPSRRVVIEQPALGEKLILELISACAATPQLMLNRQGMRMFFKRYRRELPEDDPLLTMPSLTGMAHLPTLETIIRMAAAFNVSLLDFQSDKPPIISGTLYPPKSPKYEVRPHKRLPPEVRDRVETALSKALTSEQPLMPFKTFCETLKVSTGYVSYQFPVLARTYIERLKGMVCQRKIALLSAAQSAAESGLMDKYARGEIKQMRHLIRAIADHANVSVVTARRVAALYDFSSVDKHKVH